MRKTLNTKEIKELNRKLSLPEVRVGPRKELVAPELTQAEWNHLVFVSLAKVRKANCNSFGKKFKKFHEIQYLESYINTDINVLRKKFETFSACLYPIKNINTEPFLLYIIENMNIQNEQISFFPKFDSELLDSNSFLEKLKDTFNIENLSIKGFIEHDGNAFLFIEYNERLNFIALEIVLK